MVLIYHLWPETLPGGYAGVDVFFVISGFLITGHLMRDATRTGKVALPQFWAKRARRLLPASLLVVIVSAIATLVWVPVTLWQDWFKQMGASVAYVLNWQLARDSVDYLASENNPSPVQHYWSLSVEEQFYIVWPLLIALGMWVARRQLGRMTVMAALIGGITMASFALSVYLTATNAAMAYFVTPTRVWEFGIGGLLALVSLTAPASIRAIVGWLGLVGIAVTALTFTAATPFPGYAALLPALSTAAVIWAGVTPQEWSLAHLARFRPVQYTGDISYSLYLWHWPLIVIVPYVVDRSLLTRDLWVLLAVSFLLAALTRRFVEEPGRKMSFFTLRQPRWTLMATAAAMTIALALPAGGFLVARQDMAADKAAVETVLQQSPACLGAGAMMVSACESSDLGESLYPNLASLKNDNGMGYQCYNPSPEDGHIQTCTYGSDRADAARIAVTGDSHAAMLVSALTSVADERNWSIDTFVGRGCTWADPGIPSEPDCANYRRALQSALEAGEYDMVVTTIRRREDTSQTDDAIFATARATAWSPLLDDGVPVVAVLDNPLVPEAMVDCVIEQPAAALEGTECVIPVAAAFGRDDTAVAAAVEEPRARLIDMTDIYCDDDSCPMVIGNTIVYRDRHHVTNTFVLTAAPFIADRIELEIAH